MKVDIDKKNKALEQVLSDRAQQIFLDANFLIPPDRSALGARPVDFTKYREIWLDPLFAIFSSLAVHEAVYEELVADKVKEYADIQRFDIPPRLKIYTDSSLSITEHALMQTYIQKMAPYSKYIPEKDNKKDRGEIKSLAYIAVKGFPYFAANDSLPFHLVKNAVPLETGLEDIGLLQSYEIIYLLYSENSCNQKGLKALYKYQYRLTNQEKQQNPDWGNFLDSMRNLYSL